jgi:hypothetical protein
MPSNSNGQCPTFQPTLYHVPVTEARLFNTCLLPRHNVIMKFNPCKSVYVRACTCVCVEVLLRTDSPSQGPYQTSQKGFIQYSVESFLPKSSTSLLRQAARTIKVPHRTTQAEWTPLMPPPAFQLEICSLSASFARKYSSVMIHASSLSVPLFQRPLTFYRHVYINFTFD